MPVPRVVTDVVIGGLWAASAVEVSGYTWAAISSTWSALPEPGSGSGGSGSSGGLFSLSTNKKGQLKGDPLASLIHNLTGINLNSGDKGLFGLNGPITKALKGLFSSGPSFPGAPKGGKHTPPPGFHGGG
jgi:hypothetical protein